MDSSVVMNQFIIGGIATFAIQKVKAWSGLPIVQQGATKAVRVFSSLVALLSASGILLTVNWAGPDATFTMVVAGLTVPNIIQFVWAVMCSFVAQEGWFRLLKASQQGKA